MPSKRLWCKWACPFVPQGLSFAPRFERGAKLCRPFMSQHCTPGCRSSRACMWTQLRASKAVFSSIRQIDEKTGLTLGPIVGDVSSEDENSDGFARRTLNRVDGNPQNPFHSVRTLELNVIKIEWPFCDAALIDTSFKNREIPGRSAF